MALIRLDKITKKFGEITALDHIDLSIQDGEYVCVLGQTGAGKTTLLRTIAGLTNPDSGDILIAEDADAVKKSVERLVVTCYHERFQHPFLGSNLLYYLFENVDAIIASYIREEIEKVIINYEPRAAIKSVTVKSDISGNGYNVEIEFTVHNLQQPIVISRFLTRVR